MDPFRKPRTLLPQSRVPHDPQGRAPEGPRPRFRHNLVRIKGFTLPEQSLEAKRIIGYVPETAGLYESLTAQEFLQLVGRLREIEEIALDRKIVTLLEVFEIDKQQFSRLATFSKGMRQKVMIASRLKPSMASDMGITMFAAMILAIGFAVNDHV